MSEGLTPCLSVAGLAATLCLTIIPAGCSDREPEKRQETANELLMQRVVPPDEAPAIFEFPAEVRSKNEELNAFLEEFQEICANGEYFRYRDLVSRQVEPIAREQFVGIWQAVEQVRIELIRRLPYVEKLRESNVLGPLDAVHDPVYAVLVRVDLREQAKVRGPAGRFVSLLVFPEGSSAESARWVLAPAPERVRAALRAEAGVADESELDYISGGGSPSSSSAPASSSSSSE